MTISFNGVFTLFTVFTLFFDGTERHFDCKNWLQVIASGSSAISIYNVQHLRSGLPLIIAHMFCFGKGKLPARIGSLTVMSGGNPGKHHEGTTFSPPLIPPLKRGLWVFQPTPQRGTAQPGGERIKKFNFALVELLHFFHSLINHFLDSFANLRKLMINFPVGKP